MGRLFWKILLTFWLTLLLAGGTAGLSVWLHQRALRDMADDVVVRPQSIIAVQAAASTLQFGGPEALRHLLAEQKNAPPSVQVYAVAENNEELLGRAVASNILQRVRSGINKNISPPIAREVVWQGQRFALFAPRSGQFPEYQNPSRRLLYPRQREETLIFAGIVASFISSLLLAWYFSRPIRALRQAFGDLAAGDLTRRVSPAMGRRRDELADLGRDFDHMAGQLQNLMASQRRLLHDISHELRSPLARLQVSIGLARQNPAQLEQSFERIERETERLDTLVGEVLTLSRLEAGVAQPRDEYIDIHALLGAVIEDAEFEAHALNRTVTFHTDLEESPVLQGHGELLYRAIENVVRNAIHYTPEQTQVTLTLAKETRQDGLRITVDDQGRGVPEAELEHIFEPFQRSSQGTQQQGYGLGLAIARRAIETHGGKIQAHNRAEGGLRVEITLPLSS